MKTSIYEPKPVSTPLPHAFIMRRLQSLSGLFLVLFLMEHLLTNSQAALFFGEDGKGFIEAVNFIYSLPYLPVIECLLLGFPIAIHAIWGIQYLRSAKVNSLLTDGASPQLKLPRNYAYTWQRITSILLVVGILLHVTFMRFINHPTVVEFGGKEQFIVRLKMDPGLYTLGGRLNLHLFDKKTIDELEKNTVGQRADVPPITQATEQTSFNEKKALAYEHFEELQMQNKLAHALAKEPLKKGQVAAVAGSFGTAFLMMVRDTFKSIWVCILYSIFVMAACFHACNGLWTFSISWGITITERSRRLSRHLANAILIILLFLGLASIWGTYWINLRN